MQDRQGNLTRGLLILQLLGLVLGSGCRSPAPPGQCRIKVFLQGAEYMNLDREGESIPTPVVFWQLKSSEALSEAGFEDIWQRPDEVLGDSVVERNEFMVYPGKNESENIVISEETVYVATTAVFRVPDGTGWRTWLKLPPANSVARCADGEVGGPLYFMLRGSRIRGSLVKFKSAELSAPEAPPQEGNRAAPAARDDDDDDDGDDADNPRGKKKRKKRRRNR